MMLVSGWTALENREEAAEKQVLFVSDGQNRTSQTKRSGADRNL